jgi:hypothetical protein
MGDLTGSASVEYELVPALTLQMCKKTTSEFTLHREVEGASAAFVDCTAKCDYYGEVRSNIKVEEGDFGGTRLRLRRPQHEGAAIIHFY